MTHLITLSWTTAAGVTTSFVRANGYIVGQDPLGLDITPQAILTEPYVNSDGSVLVKQRQDVRPVLLPLNLEHPTRVQTRINELARMIMAGPGRLTWADDTGVSRYLRDVVYEAGFTGDGDRGQSEFASVVLSLLALDPWWYGADISTALTLPAPAGFSAGVPFSSAAVSFDGTTATALSVTGDAPMDPVFTIAGPFTALRIAHGSSSWELARPIPAGTTVVVDHRLGVTRGPRTTALNVVDWSLLTPASEMFRVTPGASSVFLEGIGSGTISLTYAPRYFTP